MEVMQEYAPVFEAGLFVFGWTAAMLTGRLLVVPL